MSRAILFLSCLFFVTATVTFAQNAPKSQVAKIQQAPAAMLNSTFVKTEGTHFTLRGQPYYYIGANFWYDAYLGAEADYGGRERLTRELDRLHDLGVDNLRIAASSEESVFSKPLSPPFQYKHGTYNDTLFRGLDFLLVEMGKRDMKAVLFLNNYWDWTGGMAQ